MTVMSAIAAISSAIDDVLIAYWKDRYRDLSFACLEQPDRTLVLRISNSTRSTEIPLADEWIVNAMRSEREFRWQLKNLSALVDVKIAEMLKTPVQPTPIAREIPVLKRVIRDYSDADA